MHSQSSDVYLSPKWNNIMWFRVFIGILGALFIILLPQNVRLLSISGVSFTYDIFQEAIVFKFTNVVCKSHNQSWIVIHHCRLKAVSRERVVLNINATALHPAKDVTCKVMVFKKANGYKPWILQGTIDVCRYLRKPYSAFAKIIFDLFQEFSNINHTCPFVVFELICWLCWFSNWLTICYRAPWWSRTFIWGRNCCGCPFPLEITWWVASVFLTRSPSLMQMLALCTQKISLRDLKICDIINFGPPFFRCATLSKWNR